MISRRLLSILLALVTMAVATPTRGFAQSERGSITGVVEDSTKAGVPGVSVKVINTATNAFGASSAVTGISTTGFVAFNSTINHRHSFQRAHRGFDEERH